MTYLLSDINDRIALDAAQLIEDCEAAFRKRVETAADRITENARICPIVLLSGPSGAGKTTTAHILSDELKARGIMTHTISMDNYFKTMDLRTCPRTPEGEVDFESPDLLDMELLNEHFELLSHGEEIKVPKFMFTRQKRSTTEFTRLRLQENEIAIFEGIHALNDTMTDKNPGAFPLYISASAKTECEGGIFRPEWTRLCRRVVRDNNFRGASAESTLAMWGNVMRGERAHINPFRHKARYRIDSALPYEISVLKKHALPLLTELSGTASETDEVRMITELLGEYSDIPDELVPRTSLIREFIGGGLYDF